MKAYARQHFKNCPAGGSGRVVQLNNIRGLLRHAIKEFAYDSRWEPLERQDLRDLIGEADDTSGDAHTPPVLPNDLANLLDAMKADDTSSLMLLVGIIGIYGLRPHEVAQMTWEDGSAQELMKEDVLATMARELAEMLRRDATIDWQFKENVRAKLRLKIKTLLKRYKYPPDQQVTAIDLVLQQAETLGEDLVEEAA